MEIAQGVSKRYVTGKKRGRKKQQSQRTHTQQKKHHIANATGRHRSKIRLSSRRVQRKLFYESSEGVRLPREGVGGTWLVALKSTVREVLGRSLKTILGKFGEIQGSPGSFQKLCGSLTPSKRHARKSGKKGPKSRSNQAQKLDFCSLLWSVSVLVENKLIFFALNVAARCRLLRQTIRRVTSTLTLKHLKSIVIQLLFLSHFFCKSVPSSWQKVVYTPPIYITLRLPFV